MATCKVEMVEYTCDGCGSRQYSAVDEPMRGVTVNWSQVAESGEWGGTFWICADRCMSKAFKRRSDNPEVW